MSRMLIVVIINQSVVEVLTSNDKWSVDEKLFSQFAERATEDCVIIGTVDLLRHLVVNVLYFVDVVF